MGPHLQRQKPANPRPVGLTRRINRLVGAWVLCLATAVSGFVPAWGQTSPPLPSQPPQQKAPGESRDPFQPLLQKRTAPPKSKEEVALGRLKLVGIVWDRDGQARALVETEEGLGYILREKDSIMGGQVVEITSESVKFSIREGQNRPRIVSLPLYSKE